jgi:hypothetical protein
VSTDDPDRRDLLQTLATMALAGAAPAVPAAAPTDPLPFQPTQAPEPGAAMLRPPIRQRTPGRLGDFAFLDGHWRIRHQRLRAGLGWDGFDGEASCFSVLGGLASVEELRIPARRFSGMGLRVLDVQQSLWSDFWVSAASGVLVSPGQPGSFEDGAGIFESEDEEDGRPVIYRGVWDRITPRSCRWQQAASRDGGRSWQLNWSMDWQRVG